MKPRALLAWSSGKDSAWALHRLREESAVDVAGGLRARLTCVDPRQLPASFAGREFDEPLLEALPATVDPCGERGEFHSFAYAGPMFSRPIEIRAGETVAREGFVFADLLPAAPPREAVA